MKETLLYILNWIKSWDIMAIFYSILGALFVAFLLHWTGVLRWLFRKYKKKRGISRYRKSTLNECSFLIAVGKKYGFSIQSVFVELDLAPSDLTGKTEEAPMFPPTRYVLVGGPGVGKSTMTKKMIVDSLSHSRKSIPFFIRLRECSYSDSIEDYIVDKLSQHDIKEARELVQTILKRNDCLCVLDGLDEVRPHLLNRVCNHINSFYQKYFESNAGGRLIVTCRKEAYRSFPLDIPSIWEVRPLTDQQIQRFAAKWPLGFPEGKSADTFWKDLFSTKRILDLARSPLLLVGALIQYTESNLGIPDERIEYLARISRWLVSDWAIAHGHPPDPHRPAYERVLTRLAFDMHTSEESEYPLQKAINLIENWLPCYGYQGGEAVGFLQNIITKTGILVRDIPETIVFAQFALQEYYASIEAVARLGPDGLAKMASKNWWREVILLAIARERDPTECLEALIQTSPLLAALAVAECVTPSIEIQERAITACITAIDANDDAAKAAAVPLLRKVVGQQESAFLAELENRLTGAPIEIASAIVLILATAGTPAATEVLVRHPTIWETCLKNVGYLSNTFENLLVDWISQGTNAQSRYASDLLCRRLSKDRFNQLLAVLPNISESRAEYMASLILKLMNGESREHLLINEDIITKISKCVPFVKDPKVYLKLLDKNSIFLLKEGIFPLIQTALFMRTKGQHAESEAILKHLSHSISWSKLKWPVVFYPWLWPSVLLYLNILSGNPQFRTLAIVLNFFTLFIFLYAIFAFLHGTLRPYSLLPWENSRHIPLFAILTCITIVMTAVLTALPLIGMFSIAGSKSLFKFNIDPKTLLVLVGYNALIALAYYIYKDDIHLSKPEWKALKIWTILFSSIITFMLFYYGLMKFRSLFPTIWMGIFTLCYLLWINYSSITYFFSWLKVLRTKIIMSRTIDRL